jgi:hypothetical protein
VHPAQLTRVLRGLGMPSELPKHQTTTYLPKRLKTMTSSKSTIEMSPQDLESFAKQAKLTLELLNETLLGLQSRLTYNAHLVETTDLVDLTFTLTFLTEGALEKGSAIHLY